MKAQVALFTTSRGTKETRIYFEQFPIGETSVPGVSVFPHVCGTCVGGDHTHVDLHQAPERVLREIDVPQQFVEAVASYISTVMPLNRLTAEMHKLLQG